MNPQLAKELKKIDESARETYIDILTTQAELIEKVGMNFQSWTGTISALSITVGSAIIPLTLVSSKNGDIHTETTIGALLLIGLGACIQFAMKHQFERGGRDASMLGWRHKAVLAERRESYKKLTDGEITFSEYMQRNEAGNKELGKQEDIKEPSRRPNISTDIYLMIFLIGLALISKAYIPNNFTPIFWFVLIILGACYLVYVAYLVQLVRLNNKKIAAYERRIKNSGM